MKRTVLLLSLSLFAFTQNSIAQFTQLEFASGISKTDFTSIAIQPLNAKESFSFSTLAFYQKYHTPENSPFDEVGVQSNLFWNFSKTFSIGPSLYYNSVAGFSERISGLYSLKSKRLILTVIPSVAHMELTKFINGEVFMQVQYNHPLNKQANGNWLALIGAFMLTHWDKFSDHSRSFQQIRAGLSYKGNQFGFALDLDQYGKKPITKTSAGIFIRKVFTNK